VWVAYGMEWYCFPLFGFIIKEWNGMELDGIDSIPSKLEGKQNKGN
jgi:hypothetical protein